MDISTKIRLHLAFTNNNISDKVSSIMKILEGRRMNNKEKFASMNSIWLYACVDTGYIKTVIRDVEKCDDFNSDSGRNIIKEKLSSYIVNLPVILYESIETASMAEKNVETKTPIKIAVNVVNKTFDDFDEGLKEELKKQGKLEIAKANAHVIRELSKPEKRRQIIIHTVKCNNAIKCIVLPWKDSTGRNIKL